MLRRALHIALVLVFCGISTNCLAQQSNEAVVSDIKGAYENLDFSVAEARIQEALASFERFSPNELGEIHTVYALILFARNDQAGTRKQLALALQVNPALQLSPRDTPPQVMEFMEELQALQRTTSVTETELRYLIVEDRRPAAVMRSMILPGWGQLYKNERKKGILLMSAWGATSVSALVAHLQRQQAEDDYLAATTPADIANRYDTFDTWHKARNNLAVAAAGIWVFSYVDALLRNPTPGNAPVRLNYVPTPHQHNVRLTVRF